jgi:hypothetical protein
LRNFIHHEAPKNRKDIALQRFLGTKGKNLSGKKERLAGKIARNGKPWTQSSKVAMLALTKDEDFAGHQK